MSERCGVSGETRTASLDRRIYLISMIRNDADICALFLYRAAALFDKVLIADHQSTDGTREILEDFARRTDKFEIYEFPYKGYYQREISTCLARHAFQSGADWVFLLDADEILDVDNAKAFHAILDTFSHTVMNLRWINLIPTNLGSFADFDFCQAFRWDGHLSSYGKIAINAAYAVQHPHFQVHQGNHAVSAGIGLSPAAMHEQIHILHIPIRSLERLRYKLAAGLRAYDAKSGRNPAEGFHWVELNDRLEQGTATLSWINGVIARYGQPLNEVEEVDPVSKGRAVRFMPGATDAVLVREGMSSISVLTLADTIVADDCQTWREFAEVKGGLVRASISSQEISLAPQPVSHNRLLFATFGELFGSKDEVSAQYSSADLAQAISHAFVPIDKVVPSAWTEHAPLLFALFFLLRPRRYVEIGTHNGMSFFAACQASQRFETSTQCVAIDTWEGEKHAGFYEDDIFNEFKRYFESKRWDEAYYIRGLSREALSCFDARSIDVLLIDALHTYEAVSKDYESWLPKMSPRGVILFHDTNVYKNDFGVWQLWNELSRKHPHFEFPNCHGLGVVYVGTEASPFRALLEKLAENETLSTIAVTLFAALGPTSVRRTVLQQDQSLAELELNQRRNMGNTSELLARVKLLNAQNDEMRRDVDHLRRTLGSVWGSTSWKLTKPMRLIGQMLKSIRRSAGTSPGAN